MYITIKNGDMTNNIRLGVRIWYTFNILQDGEYSTKNGGLSSNNGGCCCVIVTCKHWDEVLQKLRIVNWDSTSNLLLPKQHESG